jgi:hypothetical protein
MIYNVADGDTVIGFYKTENMKEFISVDEGYYQCFDRLFYLLNLSCEI